MSDDTKLALRRTLEMASVFMIGDGMLGMLQPKRHIALWRSDVAVVDGLVRPFADKPTARRIYGTLQIVGGLGLGLLLKAPYPAVITDQPTDASDALTDAAGARETPPLPGL